MKRTEVIALNFCSELDKWHVGHALLVLTGDHWQTCKQPRQDPFQRPLLYKDSYSTHHIHYGNTKHVLCIRKVYYTNKMYTKLRHRLRSICEIEINRKNIDPSAANLK